jgi:DNA-cytosine methyltransferase
MTPTARSRPYARQRPITFLSLFAGVGGFDLALERVGMRCVSQVEIDPVCRSILARHFPEVARHDDVRTTIAWWHAQPRPAVDLVCAGWPCHDVSQAGRRAGLAGARTGLFFDLACVIGALSPRWLLLENVPGLLSSNKGQDFQAVLATLDELGYGVSWRVLDARYFGVAQRRRRVLLVGRRGGVCPFEILFESQGGQGDPAPRGPSAPTVARHPYSRHWSNWPHTTCRSAPRRRRQPRRRRDPDRQLRRRHAPAATAPTPSSSTPRRNAAPSPRRRPAPTWRRRRCAPSRAAPDSATSG